MQQFCSERPGLKEQLTLISRNIEFYTIRLYAFEHKKILGKNSLLSCLKYLEFYPEPRSIAGDLYRILH